jgi:hypothetical protein
MSVTITDPGSRSANLVAPGRVLEITGAVGNTATIRLTTGDGQDPRLDLSAPRTAAIALRPVEATTVAKAGGIQVTVGRQGPAGISGVAGAGNFVAGENISGHRFIRFNDQGEMVLATSDSGPAVGIVRDAVASGASTRLYKDGSVNGFSGLEPGARYFLSAMGSLTTTAPSTGIIQAVGTAATATILIVEIGEPAYQ